MSLESPDQLLLDSPTATWWVLRFWQCHDCSQSWRPAAETTGFQEFVFSWYITWKTGVSNLVWKSLIGPTVAQSSNERTATSNFGNCSFSWWKISVSWKKIPSLHIYSRVQGMYLQCIIGIYSKHNHLILYSIITLMLCALFVMVPTISVKYNSGTCSITSSFTQKWNLLSDLQWNWECHGHRHQWLGGWGH